jgi:hypothetical protein
VFTAITVHLGAGALAFGLAGAGLAPLPALLGLVRDRLARALDRYPGHPAAGVLRARVLDADRLPGPAMFSGISGTSGPNYLKHAVPDPAALLPAYALGARA